MPNSSAHMMFAALTVGGGFWGKELMDNEQTMKPAVGAGLAWMLGTLPDKIEPAIHPHHRQFFHSVTFSVIILGLLVKAYEWQTENEAEEFSRFVLLVLGGSYVGHLFLDALTKRSLPLLGKLNA